MSIEQIRRDERAAFERAAKRFRERLLFNECECEACWNDALHEAKTAYYAPTSKDRQ